MSWTASPDYSPCADGVECHLEYCFGLTLNPNGNGYIYNCAWQNNLQSRYSLPATNGSYTLYSEYRVVAGGTAYPSLPGSYTIVLNQTAPSVTLNSPTGILNPADGSLQQTQTINGTPAQCLTFTATAASGSGESATTAEDGCTASGLCSSLTGSVPDPAVPPCTWMWAESAPGSVPGYSYVSLTAADQSGNQASTTPAASTVFSLFNPTTTQFSLTCNPPGSSLGANPVLCTTLADQNNSDIPNDPPSSTTTTCGQDPETISFSGYADPSLRADPLVTGGYGTNLWMLYSWPEYWSILATETTACSNTPAVEIHLAYSNADAGPNRGANWTAWCLGAACDSQTPVTPIWPSEPYCSGQVNGMNCTASCAIAGASTCFSSHEVANFWPYVSGGTETWYAVHLMYYVPVGQPISTSEIGAGCLVMGVAASTPANLGWAAGNGPNACGPSPAPNPPFPSGNYPLYFSTLTGLLPPNSLPAGETCNSWGEPAIIVAAAPPGYTGNAAYLAVSCIASSGVGQGYFIFFNQNLTSFPNSGWTYYSGPFDFGKLPPAPLSVNQEQPVDSITELDWAVRPDGSMVAVVTPAYVYDPNQPEFSPAPFQYGCLAVNFTLLNTTNPFGSLVATLNDMDGSSGTWEIQGSDGCTYEPTSNTGVVIVRHLTDTTLSNPTQGETFSLFDTGVLP